MNPVIKCLVPLTFLFAHLGATADDWKDESGKRERREFKEEFWDGNCKVERKMEKNGDYEEKRKCEGPRRKYRAPRRVVEVEPVRDYYVEPPPPSGIHISIDATSKPRRER